MAFECMHDYFVNEGEAITTLETAGKHAIAADFPAQDGAWHWHEFDAEVWVVSGSLGLVYEGSDEVVHYPAGSRILAKSRVLHREVNDAYRGVVGISEDPATLSMPIDKPPEALD
jgi:hypothetical protein